VAMRDIDKSDSRQLAELMGIQAGEDEVWGQQELAAMWQHQLSAPVEFDLTAGGVASAEKLTTLTQTARAPINTFADLLHHPDPPLELLELIKQFAKASETDPDRPLPHDIASALYFASICAALTRQGERITKLDDDSLRRGFQWVMDQAWLEERTRTLLRDGLARIECGEAGPG